MRATPSHHERFLVSLAAAPSPLARLGVTFRHLRYVKVTWTYLALVIALSILVNHVLAPAERTAFIQDNSTNLTNLRHGRVYTLFTSAVVLDGRLHLSTLLALLLVLGAAELAWGPSRSAAVFLYGHVTASLLILVGLRAGIRGHLLDRTLAHANDVGVSYGLVAVLGALVTGLPLRRMWIMAMVALAALAAMAGYSFTFTDFGHLLALLLGMLAGVTVRRRARHWLDLGQASAQEPTASADQPPANSAGVRSAGLDDQVGDDQRGDLA